MTTNSLAFNELSDRDLLATVQRLALGERQATTRLIASLAELDTRRLYLGEGYASLFTYCTQALHLSEHAAYGRIEAARAARAYPVILRHLEAGDITLTTIGLLAPHLTPDNHRQLLDAARHKSKREVEHLVATLRPQPPASSLIRKLPDRSPVRVEASAATSPSAAPLTEPPALAPISASRPPEREITSTVVKPLDAERYKVRFTATGKTLEKLRRVQDLMRHTCPDGDVGIVFERALTMLLEHLERTKLAQASRTRDSRGAATRSRHIPAAVRRAVWARDSGQCAFLGRQGRCTERGFLEFHHVVPFADGGTAVVENIQLRCRAHNQYESQQLFGAGTQAVVREHRDCGDWLFARSGPS
jgi:5-methylcytosine-specific restriction endonuclease McrA